jgi:hypothetical protein
LYSVADQTLFGREVAELLKRNSCDKDNNNFFSHLEYLVGRDQSKYTCLPVDDTTNKGYNIPLIQLTSHGHLTNYGGTYYSYLYSRLCANQIFDNLFGSDPFSRTGGQKLWRDMLQFGSSRNAKKMLKDIGGL